MVGRKKIGVEEYGDESWLGKEFPRYSISAVIRVNERRKKEEGGKDLDVGAQIHPINATTLEGWHATLRGPIRGMAIIYRRLITSPT